MKQMINGRLVELQTDRNGGIDSGLLRRAAGIPDDRPLILQMPDGSNKIVNPGERVSVSPTQSFIDAPAHKRGTQEHQGLLILPMRVPAPATPIGKTIGNGHLK